MCAATSTKLIPEYPGVLSCSLITVGPTLSRVTPMNKKSLSRLPGRPRRSWQRLHGPGAVWLGQSVPAWEFSLERLLQEVLLMIQQVMQLPASRPGGLGGEMMLLEMLSARPDSNLMA